MAKQCIVTQKGTIRGNHVAHCNKKVRRSFKANVRSKRFWVESEKRYVRMSVSSKGMRIIDKNGIDAVLAKLRAKGEKI